MREQDQALLSNASQMRVQQFERSRALVVQLLIVICNVENLAPIHMARIVELTSGFV